MTNVIMGDNFSYREMYNMDHKINPDSGVDGYQIKIKHFDCNKAIKEKEDYDFNTFKKKRKNKKIQIPKNKEKFTNTNPGPWNYDLELKWCPGYKNIKKKDKYDNSKFKRKWLSSAKYQRPKAEEPKTIKDSEKKKIKKHTYIDEIINKNKKKEYPLPGPGSHFNDEKLIKKLKVENKEKFYLPKKEIKKYKYIPHKRIDYNPKARPKTVGPGSYNPKTIDKTYKVNYENFKKHNNYQKEKEEHKKECLQRDKDRLAEIKEKVKFDLKAKFEPIPSSYTTFDKIAKKRKEIGKTKFKNGFGSDSRFPLSEKEKWNKKIDNYNKTAENPISKKSDPQPGPSHYNLINEWPGKPLKIKGNSNNKNNLKLYNRLSKGPVISNYYKK